MKCSIERTEDEIRVVPKGDVDMHVAPEFRKILHEVVDESPSKIVVDLSHVPFIDSSGIATLVEVLKLSRKGGSTLEIEGCSDTVRDTFDIAGLTQILGIS